MKINRFQKKREDVHILSRSVNGPPVPPSGQTRRMERTPARPSSPVADRTDLVQTISNSISGLSDVVWNWSEIEDFTVKAVDRILAARGTPRSQVTPPSMTVAVPAIEAMRYSLLREQIAALLATSMDTRLAHEVHPSFIEMLKQLTMDEVRLLRAMPAAGLVLPLAHVNYLVSRNQVISGHRNIVPVALARVCEARRSLPHYIDNLIRMNVIEVPRNLRIDDERRYKELLGQPFVSSFVAAARPDQKLEVERSLFGLTNFGETFRRVCLS